MVQQCPVAPVAQTWAIAQFSSAGRRSEEGCLAVVRSLHKGTSMCSLSCRRKRNEIACPKDGSRVPQEKALALSRSEAQGKDFSIFQQAFTGYSKIEHMIRNQIMARGAADANGHELFRLIRREFSICSSRRPFTQRACFRVHCEETFDRWLD